jgi:uncharacterized protein
VVTNVTNFGAFVDIGVHQDGLVHISALADKFVKDPREVVKAGDVVKVKVMEVDIPRKRIGLSMRMSDDHRDQGKGGSANAAGGKKPGTAEHRNKKGAGKGKPRRDNQPAMGGAMADAFAKLKKD